MDLDEPLDDRDSSMVIFKLVIYFLSVLYTSI